VIGNNDGGESLSLSRKVWQVNWLLILMVCLIASIGFAMLYSAANGSMDPWASRQMGRFAVGLVVMFCVALVDIGLWLRYAYLIYFFGLVLLVLVALFGTTGMGAQRWLSLGFMNLQPSEFMKIALVLALARYFHLLDRAQVNKLVHLFVPLALVAAPTMLVLRQPDLGTALMLVAGSGVMFFLAGIALWKFAAVGIAGLASIPVAWQFLHSYQRQRILTFLNPESDPLGAGYHTMQSKIALGSGGVFGKGFLAGTQSHLNFLPEKQTDFIFTMLAEEFGMVGGLTVLTLYTLVIVYGFAIALRSRNQFGRLVGLGVTTTMFLYMFINIAMVMGLLPVVGVPLPLISYGGTAMLTLMFGFGLLMSVYVHRDVRVGRYGPLHES
jgi:rod shape determining protein RodA